MVYKEISIKNYKCFKDFTFKNLKRFNIITGRNNVGKTNLLEAIFILSGTSPLLMLTTYNFRGMPFFQFDLAGTAALESPLNIFFNHFNAANQIELSCKREGSDWHKAQIESAAPSALLVQTTNNESNVTFRGMSQEICSYKYTDSNNRNIFSKIIIFTIKD